MEMKISYRYYPFGKTRALTMSYDDGQIHDRRLVDIFNRYGIKGTFHLNAGTLDTSGFLKADEVRSLFAGHEISAHSYSHPFLTKLPREEVAREIWKDRKRLELLAEYPVRGMSYPFGDYNETLVQTLPALGIEYSRTVQEHGDFTLPEQFLTWCPTCHHEQCLMERCREFHAPNPWDRMPLFYVWGHSYEFDRNNNWALIEEFCKIAGADESTWFATNIEILDYLNALRGLKYSVECDRVFNPSAIPVWIDVQGNPVRIEPGKIICV